MNQTYGLQIEIATLSFRRELEVVGAQGLSALKAKHLTFQISEASSLCSSKIASLFKSKKLLFFFHFLLHLISLE